MRRRVAVSIAAAVLAAVPLGSSSTAKALPQASNEVVVFLVDDLHFAFRSTPRVRDLLLKRILPVVMHEGQQVGIVTTGYSSVSLRPTTDRDLVFARLRTITGSGLRPDAILDERNTPERVRRGHMAIETAKQTIEYLSKQVASRKTILYWSDGYGEPVLTGEVDEIIAAAYRANVTIHTFDSHVLGGSSPELTAFNWSRWDAYRVNAQDSLRRLAESTGGRLTWTLGDLDSALEQIGARG